MMMAGERQGACAIVRNWQLTEPFARRADAACRLLRLARAARPFLSHRSAGWARRDVPLDLGHGQPPAACAAARPSRR